MRRSWHWSRFDDEPRRLMPLWLTHAWNPLVVLVLRSPLHRLFSKALLLVSYAGRRTGQTRTLPVMYARDGDRLLVLVAHPGRKVWWRNFDGAPRRAVVRERGRSVGMTGTVVHDQQRRIAARDAYLKRFPGAARGAADAVVIEFSPEG
jgi:deazaflavin-dependent oxidoreductase (nitroreductase family)